MITMIKIDETNINHATDDEQAVLIGYIGKKVSADDLKDLVSLTTLQKLNPTNKEVNVTNIENNTKTTLDERFIHIHGYGLVPESKSDAKLMGKSVTADQLSKKLLVQLVAHLAADRDEAEEPKDEPLTHEEQVILFWQDIGWDKSELNIKQMRWARSVAKHVQLVDNSRKLQDGTIQRVWAINWSVSYYKGKAGVLRNVMKSWAMAAQKKGLTTKMAPTALLVYFN